MKEGKDIGCDVGLARFPPRVPPISMIPQSKQKGLNCTEESSWTTSLEMRETREKAIKCAY